MLKGEKPTERKIIGYELVGTVNNSPEPKEEKMDPQESEGSVPEVKKSKTLTAIVITCAALGLICIVNTLIKSWVTDKAIPLDYYILGAGVLLATISLLGKFEFGFNKFSGETGIDRDTLYMTGEKTKK